MHGWAINIEELASTNTNYREVLYTGEYSQLTIMSVAPGDEVGTELHRNIDQFVHVESGIGRLTLGPKKNDVEETHDLEKGWAGFIPAGAWHNIVNTGTEDLRFYTVHCPALYPREVVYETRAEAEAAEREISREITLGIAGAEGFGA